MTELAHKSQSGSAHRSRSGAAMSTARQRLPLALASSNGTNEEPALARRLFVNTGAGTGRRTNRYRRNRLSATVITGFSVLLIVVIAAVRRVRVMQSPHGNILATFPLPESMGVLQTIEHASRHPTLTAFLEPPNTLDADTRPLPPRKTAESLLTKIEYPQVSKCSQMMETWPIDDFPSGDPFLPWIHDVFPTLDGKSIQFVAQNKRRCHVGDDKEHEMKHWEPQISLLQPLPVVQQNDGQYRLSSPEEATWNETRCICWFHTATQEYTTFSQYPFNYEYISWRKNEKSMLKTTGKDNLQFWLSQLLFSCPVPEELQSVITCGSHVVNDESNLWLDLVPIRTPVRRGRPLFTQDHIGPDLLKKTIVFDTQQLWGNQHVLPPIRDSGRWSNIPICLPPPPQHYRLVACTWTAASYTRRGDAVTMSDTEQRLREWILFHEMVGFEQIHIYDNTVEKVSPLKEICAEFDFVSYHKWPAAVCNNNRPNNHHPGERSSQYAAEASCRQRFGPRADWMAFIDTDEYLVPMKSDTWKDILDEMDAEGMKVLKMKSSRSKPRLDLMEVQVDQTSCVDPSTRKSKFQSEGCVFPRKNETFLRTYNCEFIKPPRPDRFQRAMVSISPCLILSIHLFSHILQIETNISPVARMESLCSLFNSYG